VREQLTRSSCGRRGRALLAALLFGVAAVGVGPAQAAGTAGDLYGWQVPGATYPARALDLFAPAGTILTAARVHVSENGHPVTPLTVTPVSRAAPGDFGVEVLVDRSTSVPVDAQRAELAALRTFAATRTGNQQLGLVTISGHPALALPPTADAGTISARLVSPLPSAAGQDVTGAMTLGLAQLAQSHVALGAIVVLSDGVGIRVVPGAGSAVQSAAAAAGVPVITVGVRDSASTAASLHALAQAAPGQFTAVNPGRLSAVMQTVSRVVTRGAVVRWRSRQPAGSLVRVTTAVDGVQGETRTVYRAPGTAAPHPVVARVVPHFPRLAFQRAPQLSLRPSFVVSGVTPATLPPAAPLVTASGSASSTRLPLVGAALVGALIAIAFYLIFHRPAQHAVRTRVGSYVPALADQDESPDALTGTPADGSFLNRTSWWPAFVANVAVARSPHTPAALVKRSVIAGVVSAALLLVIGGSTLPAILPLIGWPFALRYAMQRAARKQQEKFRDSLPGYLSDLASAMRVGRSFVSALTVVADGSEEPIRSELERAITDESLGMPLEVALEAVAHRMDASDMEQVALVAGLNRRSGSNVSESLDRVADGARERADMRREVKALTGQARMSSSVLTALPALLLGGISLISPRYSYPFWHTTVGPILLAVGAALVFAGWKVMKKISEVKV
jgi:Flp pilus assembly protein TadB